MDNQYTTIHNVHEQRVFSTVERLQYLYPALEGNPDLLADVACVALNRLPPRYIRHSADFHFYQTEKENAEQERALNVAVRRAFEYVQARVVTGARR